MKKSKIFKQVNPEIAELYDNVTRTEQAIIDKFQSLKKMKNRTSHHCEHLVTEEECPAYQPTFDYYDLFWKTYILNSIKAHKISMLEKEVKDLQGQVTYIERKFQKYGRLVKYRKKEMNEDSQERQRFICEEKGCGKAYGSHESLKLHQNLKHGHGGSRNSENESLGQLYENSNSEIFGMRKKTDRKFLEDAEK